MHLIHPLIRMQDVVNKIKRDDTKYFFSEVIL
jgi:hypothetical protein